MDMLLRHVAVSDLEEILRANEGRSPAPYLTDPKAVCPARRLAKKNGAWDDLNRNFDPSRDIPVMKRSAYRNFRRCGDRSLHESNVTRRRAELRRAVLALWLGHPRADVDYVQDLLWAYCDEHTWVLPAHEGRAIDLASAGLGATLAEILHVLGDRLEDEVSERVAEEIERRIFQGYWGYAHLDAWRTCENNWNLVCNCQVIRAALYLIEDPVVLADLIHPAIQNMTYALDGFTEDGGCKEGTSYWSYGFGHYLYAAHALHLKTDGRLNIMNDAKIERICRYPLAAHIAGPLCSTFADAHHGWLRVGVALVINEFYRMPELYELCEQHPDRTLKVTAMHELALYRGQTAKGRPDDRDYLLPDLAQVKLRGRPGKRQVTLLAIAGDNGVPHNHNDIGSFIVHRGGRLLLVDPGAPAYTRKTFSSRRYDIAFCNALGHSVPVINGKLQRAGRRYYGTLSVENLNGDGEKRAVLDMAHAYPRGTVKELTRTFILDAARNRLVMEDRYEFSRKPTSLQEAFITFERVTVGKDRHSVQIGPGRGGLRLRAADALGTFDVVTLVEESREGRTGEVIKRITFAPARLARSMCLRFEMT